MTAQDNAPTDTPDAQLPPELQLQAMEAEHQQALAYYQRRCATLHANIIMRETELQELRALVAARSNTPENT